MNPIVHQPLFFSVRISAERDSPDPLDQIDGLVSAQVGLNLDQILQRAANPSNPPQLAPPSNEVPAQFVPSVIERIVASEQKDPQDSRKDPKSGLSR